MLRRFAKASVARERGLLQVQVSDLVLRNQNNCTNNATWLAQPTAKASVRTHGIANV